MCLCVYAHMFPPTQVASEDNVLYTAQQYVDNILQDEQEQAARDALAPLIRCPHVSLCHLVPVLSGSQSHLLLHELRAVVEKLVRYRLADPKFKADAEVVAAACTAAPASWSLKQRAGVRADGGGVKLTWSLPVSWLRAAAERCAFTQQRVTLQSPLQTRPLRGVAWRLQVECRPSPEGTTVGVFVAPAAALGGTVYRWKCSVSAAGTSRAFHSQPVRQTEAWGWRDFFSIGAMDDGWDEEVLAAKGVRDGATLQMRLHVTSAGHGGI